MSSLEKLPWPIVRVSTMIRRCVFVYLVFCAVTSNAAGMEVSRKDSKLLLVQPIMRHGDRTPTDLYPTDPNKDVWKKEDLGKLTRLGRKQCHALGKFLRSRYERFITTNPKEVLVNSSAVERVLLSAETTISAFYAPKGRWKFKKQPIPIYNFPPPQDKFLTFAAKCPRADLEMLKNRHSEKVQEFFKKHQAQVKAISNYSGLNIDQEVAFYLYDTLQIEKKYHLKIPEWADRYWGLIHEMSDLLFAEMFNFSTTGLRLRTGPLLGVIIENMEKKINGDLPDLKVRMHATHDVVITAVLRALGFPNLPQPPYTATLLFELHEMADASAAVRILYRNSTNPVSNMGQAHVLKLDGCSEFYPLENFANKLRHLIPQDWEQECQL